MMRYLISGGTGFIGRHLVRRLLMLGAEVHVLSRGNAGGPALPPDATVHVLPDALATVGILQQVKPQVCFHLATHYLHDHQPADIATLLNANIVYGTYFADAAARAGCRAFVAAGTASQFGPDGNYAPASLYAAAKHAFQDLLAYFERGMGLPSACVLLYDTYGPQDTRGKLLSQMLTVARDGGRLAMSPGEQEIDLLHIEDALDGLLAAAAALADGAPHPPRYTLSSGEPLTLRALAGRIERITGSPLEIDWGARPYRANEVMQTWKGGEPPPGWQPQHRLEDFLRAQLAVSSSASRGQPSGS